MNKVMLIGYVARDGEVKHLQNNAVVNFTVATTESWKDKQSGEWKEKTEWNRCVGWGYLADKALAKGTLVYVEGKLETRKYESDGVEKYATEIIAQKIDILKKPEVKDYDNSTPPPADDDDLPF